MFANCNIGLVGHRDAAVGDRHGDAEASQGSGDPASHKPHISMECGKKATIDSDDRQSVPKWSAHVVPIAGSVFGRQHALLAPKDMATGRGSTYETAKRN